MDSHIVSVFDVAKYILNKQRRMSTWKLQKLCCYAQAWSLAWTEKPIFQEDFEAWANGPVCPELFRSHRGMFTISAKDLTTGNPDNLTDDQKETIDIVINDYGKMEPYKLRELTHKEDPWKNARGNLAEGAIGNTIITKESLGLYYGSL